MTKRALLAAVLLLVLLPVAVGLGGTILPALSSEPWRALFATPGLARAITLTLFTGIASAVISLGLAHLLLAVYSARLARERLRAAMLPLLATPHLALAIGVALLLAPSGWLLRALSPWLTGFTQPPDWATIQDPWGLSLVLGLVLKETPFLVLALGSALTQVPSERLMLQARTLGYRPFKSWCVAVAPLLQRQIRLPFAAVVAFGLGNVDVAIALGPSNPPTLAILLWQWFTDPDLSRRALAAAGAVMLTGLTALALWALQALAARVRRLWLRHATSGRRHDSTVAATLFANSIGALLLATGLLALIALVLRSLARAWRFPEFLPRSIDMNSWSNALATLTPALGGSVGLALLTAFVALLVSLWAAETLRPLPQWRTRLAALLFVPLIVPQFGFLYGLQVALSALRIEGTWTAMLLTHLLFVLPYVFAFVVAAHTALDARLPIVARSLGASPTATFAKVTLPLLARTSLQALALGFAVSLALLLPSLFAGAGRFITFATEAAATMTSGSLRSAAVYGSAQALLPLLGFAAAALAGALVFRRRAGVPA